MGHALLRAAGRLPGRRRVGAAVGRVAFWGMRRRRRIADINLRHARPDLSAAARGRLVRDHFAALGQWFMDNLWGLSATPDELRRFVRLEGDAPAACIILAPHFLGLELALLRLNLYLPNPAAFHYKPMHNAFWDAHTLGLRRRFGGVGFSTAGGGELLAAVRHCRDGGALCYLPDVDPHARKSTVFVPFMGVARAATTTALSRLARAARVPVVPYMICRDGDGYVCRLLPPLRDFPSGDDRADAVRLNELIGEWVAAMPENYFWLHRRFKTTPDGEVGGLYR